MKSAAPNALAHSACTVRSGVSVLIYMRTQPTTLLVLGDAKVILLQKLGPSFPRPHADLIHSSRHANMKELWIQHSGRPDEVHHLAMDFGIFPTQPLLPLLAAPFYFFAFLTPEER